MKKYYLIYLIFFLFSCEKSEIPIAGHEMGEMETNQISILSDYSKQIFYSLDNNLVVKENTKTDWDLGFESSEQGWHVILNTSTFSKLSSLNNAIFEDTIIENELVWTWDNPKGINVGTAISDYPNNTTIYIINRGYNINGSQRGLKKLMIDSITSSSYFIRYSNLDNSDYHSAIIKKDNNTNFTYLSFENNSVINIEPLKEDWDLLFSQYTHLYEENTETPAYLVTGVYSNYINDIVIAKDTMNPFKDITALNINSYIFSNNQNEIGFEWKAYNFEEQMYTVDSKITYIIKSISNRYFKLRFIDFYNDNGEKGYPSFEIQEL